MINYKFDILANAGDIVVGSLPLVKEVILFHGSEIYYSLLDIMFFLF